MQAFLQNPQPGAHIPPRTASQGRPAPSLGPPRDTRGVWGKGSDTPGSGMGPAASALENSIVSRDPRWSRRDTAFPAGLLPQRRDWAGPARARGTAAAPARPCGSAARRPRSALRPRPPAAPRVAVLRGAAPRGPVPCSVPVLTSPPPPSLAEKRRPGSARRGAGARQPGRGRQRERGHGAAPGSGQSVLAASCARHLRDLRHARRNTASHWECLCQGNAKSQDEQDEPLGSCWGS